MTRGRRMSSVATTTKNATMVAVCAIRQVRQKVLVDDEEYACGAPSVWAACRLHKWTACAQAATSRMAIDR